MSVKLELPNDVVKDLLEKWRHQRDQLEGEMSEIDNLIKSAEAQLKGSFPTTSTATPTANKGKTRRAKGENLRIIREYMIGMNGTGATFAAISAATGVGFSSARAVIKNNPKVFSQGHDGLWKLR